MKDKAKYITANGWAYEQLKNSARQMRSHPTIAEDMLWQAIRAKQLGVRFRRQQIIEYYIVDFVCLEQQLVIEIDGKYHLSEEQQAYDRMRTQHLEAKGYHILRFSNEEITHNLDTVTEQIKKALHMTNGINNAATKASLEGRYGEVRRLVILGAGESGAGTAVLGLKEGYEVFVSDMGAIKPQYKALMDEYGVPYEEGGHTEEKILNATEVVKSPGIPLTAPLVKKLIEQGTPILSEIEFAARYTPAKFICITGSNGKTTTTSLIYDILSRAKYNVGLAGNIGKSLALQVATADKQWYVVELSSFQLDNMYEAKADIALVMNITPDHMDRYDYCFQNYVDAKMRIAQNQEASDALLYWSEDPVVTEELKKHSYGATLYAFGSNSKNSAYIENGVMHVQTPRADALEMPADALSLKGVHNALNSMAAALAAQLAGVPNGVIEESLRTFAGVEHRLQFVAEKNGVQWINDSKATNVNSCFYALGAMTRPTVLVLGGKDKGNDYSEIDELVKEKCHTIVYMGLHNEKLHEHFDGMQLKNGGVLRTIDTNTLADAIRACVEAAQEGDTVLLSPCCASFDLFKSYEDRGEQWMAAVKAL